MDDEKGIREQTLAGPGKDEKSQRRPFLLRLEDRGIRMLWSFVERDAGTWRFWVKVTVVMLIMNTALPIAIYLFFLGRDLGYFEGSRHAAEYNRLEDPADEHRDGAVFDD
ncbi:MAG: hypothetical protein GY772_09070 [bacterium]|jgi:hypothetical protein|nr:hypothetical protein [Deltaproteobacteria bacterium]MCP4240698.1 hypothetical protein [bacterium]MDP7299201.1 hypothetical protein [Myxococcota bacterium]HJO23798.1 hypothetical protein [Myxococcota bacterium]